MNLPRLNTNLNNVSSLSDRPNQIEGLSSTELKRIFDTAGNELKDYLNNSLLPAIEIETKEILNDIDPSILPPSQGDGTFSNPMLARSNLEYSWEQVFQQIDKTVISI